MGKAARNRAIRRRALEIDHGHSKGIARALRRRGRLPMVMILAKREFRAKITDLIAR